ncbi:MAG: hypothetical protein ACRETB_13440 [Steroidobacteraceae bacterium]
MALAAVALGLCSCAGLRLSSEAPPGVNLSGKWKLDTRLSTDTRAALARIVPRRRAKQHPEEENVGLGQMQGGQPGRGPGRGSPDRQQGAPASGTGEFAMPVDTSLQRSLVSGGDYLEIEQRPDGIAISNGDTTHDYVADEKAVVSIPEGVADRRSGWKGKEFRIVLRPELGPRATIRFRLDDSGKRLIETIEVASDGQVRRLEITRVYEPTNEVQTLLPVGN